MWPVFKENRSCLVFHARLVVKLEWLQSAALKGSILNSAAGIKIPGNIFAGLRARIMFTQFLNFQLRIQYYASGSNWSLSAPQTGHTQSSGRSSNAVPAAMPFSGSPIAGSYIYPQTVHTYLPIYILLYSKYGIVIVVIIVQADKLIYRRK